MSWITKFLKDISELKSNCIKKSKRVFDHFKEILIAHIAMLIKSKRKSNAGRPISTSLDRFCDALYHLTDSGIKITSIRELFGIPIPKTTFMRYFKLLDKSECLQKIYYDLIQVSKVSSKLLIVDSFLVKSIDGKEMTGRNPCDRGRRGCKVFLVSNEHLVTNYIAVHEANTSENTCLRDFINHSKPVKGARILADAGFVGKKMAQDCQNKGYRLIARPRKTRNGKLTHNLTWRDKKELKTKRNYIEHLNGRLRRFRGVTLKSLKTIGAYKVLLFLALIVITSFELSKKV